MLKYNTVFLLAFIFVIISCNTNDGDTITDPPNEQSTPNILLIIADDMGVDASPGYNVGNVKPNMPNLESLASSGVIFDNVWSYPVCSPTRSSIISGKYGYRTGVFNAESASTISSNELTLQSYLDQNTNSKYAHAIIGKWHLSGRNDPTRPTDMGIGYYAGLLTGGVNSYDNWQLTENGESNTTNEYITTKITELAMDWIEDQTKPWFCWVAYNAPHTPIHLPEDSLHYQGVLPNDQESIDANPLPYYMAMIESLDHEIGRILNSLVSEERENTLIIFIGDNGTARGVIQNPYSQSKGKGSLYQGGIHVPLIISGQGVMRIGQRENQMISSADLFATIAEIAGIEIDNYQDSYSFFPLLSSTTGGSRTINYSEALVDDAPNRSGYTIRNQTYKLIQFDSGNQEFYNLQTDPYEDENLLDGNLTQSESEALAALMQAASEIRQ